MIQPTHARLWRQLPSAFPEIKSWGSFAGPFQYVVTYNEKTKQCVATWKRQGEDGDAVKVLGTYPDNTAAYEACEKHYRANLS